jgi:4-hydroxybenzoate polyprenyltransferase
MAAFKYQGLMKPNTSESVHSTGWFLFKQLIHLRRFAFTAFLPLMGAATVLEKPAAPFQIINIIAVAWLFHIFTYVLNDVVDLTVDRLMTKRAMHPLVRGDVSRSTALIIALGAIPISFLITLLGGGSPYRFVALGGAIVCMAIYNIWGKRFIFPPVTDFIQAISWGCLTLFGAVSIGTPGFLTWVLAGIFIVFILLMNGVFEGVIDLVGDSAADLKTTAIVFGVRREEGSDTLVIPYILFWYGIVLEALLTLLNFLPLVRNDFGYQPQILWVVSAIVIVLNVGIILYSLRFVSPWHRWRKPIKDEHIDVISALSVLIMMVSYALYVGPLLLTSILIVTILPFVL